MAEEPRQEGISYVKEALKWQYNWIAMVGAAGFAAVSQSPLPLILAGGLELIYLATVPHMARFQRLVRSRQWAAEKRAHELRLHALFQEIPPEMRKRYEELNRAAHAIRNNYKRLSSTSRIFTDQMHQKLDGLLQSYLRLLHSAYQHRDYLRQTDEAAIRREKAAIEKTLDSDPPKVQEINRKRIEILNRRLEKYEKIRENREVVDAQCAAIEDVLNLVRDQSVTMRDPQEISDHLETLLKDVEHTEETVREVEAIMELTPEMTAAPISPEMRHRVRN